MSSPASAASFFYKKSNIGCLLIHGLSGSCAELRELGEFLSNKDITCYAPLLKGHGTDETQFNKTTWHNWYSSCIDGLDKLKDETDKIFVCGLSMGGLLTLHLAQHYPDDITGIIVLSAPIDFFNLKAKFLLPLIRYTPLKYLSIKQKPDIKNKDAIEKIVCYDKLPLVCVLSVGELMEHVKKELNKITLPILIMHGKYDHLVHPSNAQFIYDNVASESKDIYMLDNSYHVITVDYDKQEVFNRTYEFIATHTTSSM